MEKYQDVHLNEAVDEQSPWKMQSAQRPLARPLFEELVAEHCSSSSLRQMDEEVTRQATAALGRRTSHEFAFLLLKSAFLLTETWLPTPVHKQRLVKNAMTASAAASPIQKRQSVCLEFLRQGEGDKCNRRGLDVFDN